MNDAVSKDVMNSSYHGMDLYVLQKQVLSSAHQDLDTIQLDLEECQNSIAVLKSLVDIVRNFERTDPSDYYNVRKC